MQIYLDNRLSGFQAKRNNLKFGQKLRALHEEVVI